MARGAIIVVRKLYLVLGFGPALWVHIYTKQGGGEGAESLAAQVSGGNQETKGFLGGRLVGQSFQRSLKGYRNLLGMARDLTNDGVVLWCAWGGL